MAVSFTITNVHRGVGAQREVHGTYTSAAGDTTATLGNSTHGLNYISDYDVKAEAGGVSVQAPKASISSGEITLTWEDTQGYSGTFFVKGR
jgi:LDH2 family malate/lactate/ureidoglycolate dehydrogenase